MAGAIPYIEDRHDSFVVPLRFYSLQFSQHAGRDDADRLALPGSADPFIHDQLTSAEARR